LKAYIINLQSEKDRWSLVEETFQGTGFELHRIEAIDGYALQLPIPEYSETLYRWFHGRPTSPGHVGCYLSHVKAMQAFLATGDEHAFIGEDDLTLRNDFWEVVQAALRHSKLWNLLRVTGLSEGVPWKVTQLTGEYSLCISLGRLKGTGGYVIDRHGAEVLSRKLLPMRLPIDHAMDREWFFGLRAMSIRPFPASQLERGFRSSIQRGKSLKLSRWRRYLATYPYQIFNEASRWIFRGAHYLSAKIGVARQN
jgi:glycosyl transferase, family 25